MKLFEWKSVKPKIPLYDIRDGRSNCFVYNTWGFPKEFAYGYNCRIYTLEFPLLDYKRNITIFAKFQNDIAFYLETVHYWVIYIEKHG